MDSLQCSQCKSVFELFGNSTGSALCPVAKCPYCGATHEFGHSGHDWDEIIESAQIIRVTAEGIELREKPKGTVEERVRDLKVLEYWVQGYVKENYRKLGFSKIEGPFEVGPDFRVTQNGQETFAEIEVRCENYLHHKHHTDSRFKRVGILIVLEQDKPSEKIRKLLPKKIVHLDEQSFTEWYRKEAKAYATQKEKERSAQVAWAKLHFIASEFHSRFLAVCADKERDMAVCPDCNSCPYFGEGVAGEAQEVFESMALEFLAHRGVQDLKLAEVKPAELDQFFRRLLGIDEPSAEGRKAQSKRPSAKRKSGGQSAAIEPRRQRKK